MPQKEGSPKDLLVNIAKILRQLKIPYLITGGMAVLIWGRPRFTADIDIVLELKLQKKEDLIKALKRIGKAGYIDEKAVEEALINKGEFNFIDGQTGIKIDFWILTNSNFDLSRLKRRRVKKITGESVYFSSPEDLILSKLHWHKESGSDRHLEDVESIFKISGKKLDQKYLKQMAGQLKVQEILKEIENKG